MSNYMAMEMEVYKIIALYRQYPCLWDYKSPLYKRTDLKRNAWEEIAREMSKSVDEVKKKIKYLRSAYVSEKRKAEQSKLSGSGADDVYRPHLYYYNELNFLDCVIALRQTSSNFPNESSQIIDVCPASFESDDKQENSPECSQDSSFSAYNDKVLSSTPNTDKSWKSLKRAKAERDTKFSDAFDAITAKVRETTEEQESMFSTFGKSISMQLSKLPLIDAVNAMADIQKLLANKIEKSSKKDILKFALNECYQSKNSSQI